MKKILAFALFAFLVPSLSGQEKPAASGGSLTLQQTLEFAMNNNPRYLNSQLDEKIAKSKVNEITGIGLPQISGNIDASEYVEQPTSLLPAEFFGGPPGSFIGVKFGTKYNATAGISASQLVFDGSYIVGLQASKVYLELSKKSSQRSKTEITSAVTKAYYTALVNTERLKLLDANLIRLKKLMDDTKVMFDNGFVEKIDHDRIIVMYNNLESERQKMQRYVEVSYLLLKFQMGMEMSAPLTLADNLDNIKFETAESAGDKFDYNKRIEFSLLQSQSHLYKLDLRKNRLGYLPSVALYGAMNAQAQRNEFNFFAAERWYPMGIVGLKISVPIFDGLQKNFRIQQSKFTLSKLQNDTKMLQQSIDLEIASSRNAVQNSLSTLAIQKKNVEIAAEVYRVSKIKYEQGVGSNLEVLNAESSLKESQTYYYNALYEALIAKVDYETATGVLVK